MVAIPAQRLVFRVEDAAVRRRVVRDVPGEVHGSRREREPGAGREGGELRVPAAVDIEAGAVLEKDPAGQLVGQGRELAPGGAHQRLPDGFRVGARAARITNAQRVLRLDAEEPLHRYCPPSWRLAAR